jgi:hypothetical protein
MNMTQQQIKDYEKVQSIEILKMWTQHDERFKGYTLEELPLSCAISDMEMTIADEAAQNFGAKTARVVRMAKAFLIKYRT